MGKEPWLAIPWERTAAKPAEMSADTHSGSTSKAAA